MSYLLYGGAFNPPTKAHIFLSKYACDATKSEGVIFMPSKISYIKGVEGKNFAFSDEERISMLTKIADGKSWMKVSSYELNLTAFQPRTYETLNHLKNEENINCKLLFGSDWLPDLKTKWLHIPEIAKEYGIVCMERGNDIVSDFIKNDDYLKSLAPYIEIIKTPDEFKFTSSTQAREKFSEMKRNHSELEKIVPDELDGLKSYL